MSELEPSHQFDKEAIERSRRFFNEIKILGEPYYEKETLGDLVIDGPFHPYVFLDRHKSTNIWLKAKGLLMTIYKDYKSSNQLQTNVKWTNPLSRSTFHSEKYAQLTETTRTMIEEYVEYLLQSETETRPLSVEEYGLSQTSPNFEQSMIPPASEVSHKPRGVDTSI